MIHQQVFEMPKMYEPPMGTPLYWMAETTGVLPDALWTYIMHSAEPDIYPAPNEGQMGLVIAYLRYIINAPCWPDPTGQLAVLRQRASTMATIAEVQRWVVDCVKIGIDPL